MLFIKFECYLESFLSSLSGLFVNCGITLGKMRYFKTFFMSDVFRGNAYFSRYFTSKFYHVAS